MITSADLATGGVHVFKSGYLAKLGGPYDRDGEVLLRDAILASCAAPTFFDPRKSGSISWWTAASGPTTRPSSPSPKRSPSSIGPSRGESDVHRDRPRSKYVPAATTLGTANRLG